MEWTKCKTDDVRYFKKELFNDFDYYLEIMVYQTYKSEVYYVALSSGKKRKELTIFEEKENKSKGGIQALLWAKKEILGFPEWYKNPLKKKRYFAIKWADNRRRDIYARTLLKEGFTFQMMFAEKVLAKKIIE